MTDARRTTLAETTRRILSVYGPQDHAESRDIGWRTAVSCKNAHEGTAVVTLGLVKKNIQQDILLSR